MDPALTHPGSRRLLQALRENEWLRAQPPHVTNTIFDTVHGGCGGVWKKHAAVLAELKCVKFFLSRSVMKKIVARRAFNGVSMAVHNDDLPEPYASMAATYLVVQVAFAVDGRVEKLHACLRKDSPLPDRGLVPAAPDMAIEPTDDTVSAWMGKCAGCGKDGVPTWRCANCGGVRYCGRECQVRDWRRHKASCSRTASDAR